MDLDLTYKIYLLEGRLSQNISIFKNNPITPRYMALKDLSFGVEYKKIKLSDHDPLLCHQENLWLNSLQDPLGPFPFSHLAHHSPMPP